MRLVVLVSTVALALVAGAQASPSRGTLTGVVMRGPITPVCVAEQPCDEPAANVTLLFIRQGSVIVRTVTNAIGRYRVRLPAGAYGVRRATVRGAFDRKLEPNHARVYGGRLTRLDFSIDTGIR
jgi:hypothetical protein